MTGAYEPDSRIRAATSADAASLIALDAAVQQDLARARAITAWIADGDCFLAEQDGEAVGYGVMTDRFFRQPFLEMLMVTPNFQRHGIGSGLVSHAIATCPGPWLWTSTNQSNLPMQALLNRLGFVRSGIVEGLDQGDPELIYRIAAGLTEEKRS